MATGDHAPRRIKVICRVSHLGEFLVEKVSGFWVISKSGQLGDCKAGGGGWWWLDYGQTEGNKYMHCGLSSYHTETRLNPQGGGKRGKWPSRGNNLPFYLSLGRGIAAAAAAASVANYYCNL